MYVKLFPTSVPLYLSTGLFLVIVVVAVIVRLQPVAFAHGPYAIFALELYRMAPASIFARVSHRVSDRRFRNEARAVRDLAHSDVSECAGMAPAGNHVSRDVRAGDSGFVCTASPHVRDLFNQVNTRFEPATLDPPNLPLPSRPGRVEVNTELSTIIGVSASVIKVRR